MSRPVKVSQGTWCMAFGFDPTASLEQALQVIGAFGYDGVELAGFFDHATIERFPDRASRYRLSAQLDSLDLEPVAIAPSPHQGVVGAEPWSLTDDERVLAAHRSWWQEYLELAAQLKITRMRIDPGTLGPLPYDAEYERVWDRVVNWYRWLAEQGEASGCTMLWELESGQPFNKPSEVVRLLDEVDHPNCRLLYDTGHFHAAAVIGHNQVQPVELLEGGQIELIRRLKGRIGHVHLCDTDGDVAQNYFARKIGFGKGIVDFDELLPVLVECYDGEWWGVDAISMSSDAWGDCWDGLAFVRDSVVRHVAAAD